MGTILAIVVVSTIVVVAIIIIAVIILSRKLKSKQPYTHDNDSQYILASQQDILKSISEISETNKKLKLLLDSKQKL